MNTIRFKYNGTAIDNVCGFLKDNPQRPLDEEATAAFQTLLAPLEKFFENKNDDQLESYILAVREAAPLKNSVISSAHNQVCVRKNENINPRQAVLDLITRAQQQQVSARRKAQRELAVATRKAKTPLKRVLSPRVPTKG